jgi:ribosomal protein L15
VSRVWKRRGGKRERGQRNGDGEVGGMTRAKDGIEVDNEGEQDRKLRPWRK